MYMTFGRYSSFYLLSASAYAYADFAKTFTFIGKAYKWGYFPITIKYKDIEKLIADKKPASILWVARFIELKHPQAAIYVAIKLKEMGFNFALNMIGEGVLINELNQMINENELSSNVHMLGFMPPQEVRKYMEQSEIFLFTSDRNEGWGAVMNESMSSGCAVVASHLVGSVPFLIRNKENGLIYKDGDLQDLTQKVKWLLLHKNERQLIGKNAYFTMVERWNADIAAKKFIELSQAILSGEKHPVIAQDGICSKAKIIRDSWFE